MLDVPHAILYEIKIKGTQVKSGAIVPDRTLPGKKDGSEDNVKTHSQEG